MKALSALFLLILSLVLLNFSVHLFEDQSKLNYFYDYLGITIATYGLYLLYASYRKESKFFAWKEISFTLVALAMFNALLTTVVLDTELPRLKLFVRFFSIVVAFFIFLQTNQSKNLKFPFLFGLAYTSSFFGFSVFQNSEYKSLYSILFLILIVSYSYLVLKQGLLQYSNEKLTLFSYFCSALIFLSLLFVNRTYSSVFDNFYSFGYLFIPLILLLLSSGKNSLLVQNDLNIIKSFILAISLVFLMVGFLFYLINLPVLNEISLKKSSFLGINTNDIAPILLFLFPVLLFKQENSKFIHRLVIILIISLIVLFPLYILHVRGAWIAVVFQFMVYLFWNMNSKNYRWMVVLITAVLLFGLISTYFIFNLKTQLLSLNARFQIIESVFSLASNHLFEGVGVNQYRAFIVAIGNLNLDAHSLLAADIGRIHSHNFFIQSLLDFGIFYLLLVLFIFAIVIKNAFYYNQSTLKSNKVSTLSILGFYFYGFLNYPSQTLTIHMLFFIEIALLFHNVDGFLKIGIIERGRKFFGFALVLLLLGLFMFQWTTLREHSNILSLLKGIRQRNQLNDLVIDCPENCRNSFQMIQKAHQKISSLAVMYPTDPMISLEKGEIGFTLYSLGSIDKFDVIESYNGCVTRSMNPWSCYFRLSILDNKNIEEYSLNLRRLNPANLPLDKKFPF